VSVERVERDRLAWRCRRGLLELDLVLERFLRANAGDLDAAQLGLLHELLECDDHELWAIVSGRSDGYASRFTGLVARLRAI